LHRACHAELTVCDGWCYCDVDLRHPVDAGGPQARLPRTIATATVRDVIHQFEQVAAVRIEEAICDFNSGLWRMPEARICRAR
jgi:hypothetical protein